MVVTQWRRTFPRLKVAWRSRTKGLPGRWCGRGAVVRARFLAGPEVTLPLSLPLHAYLCLLPDEGRELSLSPAVGSPPGPPGDLEDEEGLKHLQQVWECLHMLRGCRTPRCAARSRACPLEPSSWAAQTCLSFLAPGGREAGGVSAGQRAGGGAVHRHAHAGPAPPHSRHCPSPQPRRCPQVVLQGPAGGDPR